MKFISDINIIIIKLHHSCTKLFAGCAPARTYFFLEQKVSKNSRGSIQLTENYCDYLTALALFSPNHSLS
jgi:hypothetical protein